MRRFLLIIIAALLSHFCAVAQTCWLSTSFREPATDGLRFIYSHDGLRWDSIPGVFLPIQKADVGEGAKFDVMRDPSLSLTPDGTFHLVWTSSWRGDRGFGYASSRDLKHWSRQRFIEVMADTTTVNVWAPELFLCDDGRYMIVWASCIPDKFPDYQEAHNNNHRLYYTTTRDFETFSPTRLLYDPDFSCIDAIIVKRAERDYVMVLKDNSRPQRNLKVAFASDPEGPWSAASEPFTDNFTEGPTVAKIADWWYIYYDSYGKHAYGAVRTKDFRTFENADNDVRFPQGHKHGTAISVPVSILNNLLLQ